MKITELKIPLSVLTNSKNEIVRVISITPSYKYVDGKKTTEPAGIVVEVVELTKFNKFRVKVEDTSSIVIPNQEDIDRPEGIQVEFQDFEAKYYFNKNTNDYVLSCKAKSFKVVKPANQQVK